MQPLVSVIIPNYNHAPYLRERVDSVLSQDWKNIELILLDDCSTDNSRAILAEYANDQRVSAFIENTCNSGSPFIQWRKGIEMAKGAYIWIAESDDVAERAFLSTLVPTMEKDPQIMVGFCQSKWIDQEGKPLRSTVYKTWTEDKIIDGEAFIRKYLLGYNFICNASAVVMRREAALNVSNACEKYKASGDRQFWIEVAQQGKVYYCARPCNAFRQHHHKVSNDAEKKGLNTKEDLAIYHNYIAKHTIGRMDKIKIYLYHIRAYICGRIKVWRE